MINMEHKSIFSSYLKRQVSIDLYIPLNVTEPWNVSLLLINDGQNLPELHFDRMLDQMLLANEIQPLLCVGVHAGRERLHEYGTAGSPDFKQRGSLAKDYARFIIEELLPFIHGQAGIERFKDCAFAGFSLGGLSALDIVWNYPEAFSIAGVFSGSLWWRAKDLEDGYEEDRDRIMHQQIKRGVYKPGLRFYFTTGSLDETADRNGNGIIDSIDDTLDLIGELNLKGYDTGYDIRYVNYEEGRHDMATWKKAMPGFLLWAFGRKHG